MTFTECLMKCAANKELVENFDRLTGHNLSRRGSPFDLAIDDATGRTDTGVAEFVAFVKDVVWDRVPRQTEPTAPTVSATAEGKTEK